MNEKPYSAQARDSIKLIMQSCYFNTLMHKHCVAIYNSKETLNKRLL